jgi:hypothetical protein
MENIALTGIVFPIAGFDKFFQIKDLLRRVVYICHNKTIINKKYNTFSTEKIVRKYFNHLLK